MKNIFLDIETLPTDNPAVIRELRARLRPPGNYTKEETIAKWHADPTHLNEAVGKTALSGAFGQVCCVGIATDQGPVHVMHGDEGRILADLRQILKSFDDDPRGTRLIGHNLLAFDLPFLSQRMLCHGLGPLIPFNARPWELNAMDTMTMFCGLTRELISFSNLCLALGVVKPPDTITGKDVYHTWMRGDQDKVLDHCASDVMATRACFHRMMQTQEVDFGPALALTDTFNRDHAPVVRAIKAAAELSA